MIRLTKRKVNLSSCFGLGIICLFYGAEALKNKEEDIENG